MQLGKILSCTGNQIGGYERGSSSIPPSIIFDLENMTGILANRLYYEALTRASIPTQPLSQTTVVEAAHKKTPPQYNAENLSITERLKRLETAVFGA